MTQESSHHLDLSLEQVKQLYEQSYIASAGAITASIVTGFILWESTSHANIIAWVLAAIGITGARHGLCIFFNRLKVSSREANRWKRIFFFLIAASGTIWGSSGIFLFPEISLNHQVFLFFILVGMVAGAIGTFSVVMSVFLAYAGPALIPLIIKFFWIGDAIHAAMGGMTLLFLVLSSVTAFHLNKKTLAALTLGFENLDLILHLEQAKHRADAVNKILTTEVLERQRAEEALRKYQENLEFIVNERTAELNRSNLLLQKEIEEREKKSKALPESEE